MLAVLKLKALCNNISYHYLHHDFNICGILIAKDSQDRHLVGSYACRIAVAFAGISIYIHAKAHMEYWEHCDKKKFKKRVCVG